MDDDPILPHEIRNGVNLPPMRKSEREQLEADIDLEAARIRRDDIVRKSAEAKIQLDVISEKIKTQSARNTKLNWMLRHPILVLFSIAIFIGFIMDTINGPPSKQEQLDRCLKAYSVAGFGDSFTCYQVHSYK